MHRGKNKKKIIITISILLLLCGAGAIALLIYRHMDISSTAMPVIASADTHNDNDLQTANTGSEDGEATETF